MGDNISTGHHPPFLLKIWNILFFYWRFYWFTSPLNSHNGKTYKVLVNFSTVFLTFPLRTDSFETLIINGFEIIFAICFWIMGVYRGHDLAPWPCICPLPGCSCSEDFTVFVLNNWITRYTHWCVHCTLPCPVTGGVALQTATRAERELEMRDMLIMLWKTNFHFQLFFNTTFRSLCTNQMWFRVSCCCCVFYIFKC